MRLIDKLATTDRALLEAACEQRAKTVYCGEHVVLCRVLADLMLYVDARELTVAPSLLMHGYWEFWVTQAIARHVKPGMRCADVGSNVGYYTLLLAALVGAEGEVRAYDLLKTQCSLVERSAEVNGFRQTVHVLQRAVGDVGGEGVEIQVPQGDDGFFHHFGNAAIKNANSRVPPGDQFRPGVVRGTTLDRQFGGYSRLDFVKIDVEGAEPKVWAGSTEVRSRLNPTICLEYEGWRPGYPEFLAQIKSEGYRVRFVDYSSELVPLPAEPDPERLYMLWVTR